MRGGSIDRVNPRLPALVFSPRAAEKLRLYVDLCPYEISGLGEVETLPDRFLVHDLHLPRQRCYHAYTELLPDELARFLIAFVEQGKEPARLKLWWHSHSEMELFWSPIDDYTARGFQNDYMLSLVTNKAGERRCRLDVYQPLKLTIDGLPIEMPRGGAPEDRATRETVGREVAERVVVYTD